MSTSDQFARACNRLDGYEGTIKVRYHLPGTWGGVFPMSRHTPLIEAWSSTQDIKDKDMDIAGWRQYGRAIKASPKIDKIELKADVDRDEDGRPEVISQEAAPCLYAFFEELKENTSIEEFKLDVYASSAISAVDLRYFFQNNPKSRKVHLIGPPLSPGQSAHIISNALRDIPLNELIWNVEPGVDEISRSAFEQILLACRNVKVLELFNLFEYFQIIISIAELLRDPTTLWEDLHVRYGDVDSIFDSSNERAENEILSSLHQNSKLKWLKIGVKGLFEGDDVARHFTKILCNTDSLETVYNSNHSLQDIVINNAYPREWKHIEQYLQLNRNINKKKVIQCKVMKYYFSGNFEASSLANMPLAAVPLILAIDPSMDKKHACDENEDGALRCSAILNIIKSIPEVCAVSSRGAVQSGGNVKDDGSTNKRQKVIF